MTVKGLKCFSCGNTYNPGEFSYKCSECGGILEVEYDYNRVIESGFKKRVENSNNISDMWMFKELLPINDTNSIISLREGNTPLIKSQIFAEDSNKPELYLKDESRNPTGSFKDRPLSVAISKVKEDGNNAVITSTHGNAGIAMSAYAARAGFESMVIVPEKSPANQLTTMQAYGTNVYMIKGDISDAYNFSLVISNELDLVNLATTFLSPYTTEGDKTIAYEIYCQYDGQPPEWILFPIGAGPLLAGCYKGFKELIDMDMLTYIPKLVAVQSEQCAPIANAFKEGRDKVVAWNKDEETIAMGIHEPLKGYPEDGTITLQRIKDSGGLAITVSDEEVKTAMFDLMSRESVFPEPTGSVGFAGARKLYEKGYFSKDDRLLVMITGGGFNNVNDFKGFIKKPKMIDKNINSFKRIWESDKYNNSITPGVQS